ncbi:unnamed protein product [Symbiodinium sp. CCMP2592]|nr:unnamed protein product [Symbiodinium sp. CCMP2592]
MQDREEGEECLGLASGRQAWDQALDRVCFAKRSKQLAGLISDFEPYGRISVRRGLTITLWDSWATLALAPGAMLTCLGLSARNWRQQIQFHLWADGYAQVAPQQHVRAAGEPDHAEAGGVGATAPEDAHAEADGIEATAPEVAEATGATEEDDAEAPEPVF